MEKEEERKLLLVLKGFIRNEFYYLGKDYLNTGDVMGNLRSAGITNYREETERIIKRLLEEYAMLGTVHDNDGILKGYRLFTHRGFKTKEGTLGKWEDAE